MEQFQNRQGSTFAFFAVKSFFSWGRKGWSRPSGLHAIAVEHWALAPEVLRRLKPHGNTAFNAALNRCSPRIKICPPFRGARHIHREANRRKV
jgi:hypothetical protein